MERISANGISTAPASGAPTAVYSSRWAWPPLTAIAAHSSPHARAILPRCYTLLAVTPPPPPYTLPLILFAPSLPQAPPSAHLHRSILPPHTLPSNTIHTLTTPLIITTSPPSPQPSLPESILTRPRTNKAWSPKIGGNDIELARWSSHQPVRNGTCTVLRTRIQTAMFTVELRGW